MLQCYTRACQPTPTNEGAHPEPAQTAQNYLHHFWTRDLQDALWPVIQAQHHGRDAIRKAFNAIPPEHRATLTAAVANGRLPLLAGHAFALPVLSKEGCATICARSSRYTYRPNDEEAPEHRINEAVVSSVDPDYHQELRSILMAGLAPWLMMIWGRLPSTIASLQVASYETTATSETAHHIDRDSAYTAVVSLNPQDITGGGTAICDGLLGEMMIPPLPVGHALIFDGRRTVHRGLPVLSGNRKLLVLWANQNNDDW